MRGLVVRLRSFWRAVRRQDQLQAEMDEEMRFHIEMEAQRMARERQLSPEEARRPAAIAFGGVERRQEEARDVWGLSRVSSMSLDARLAWRMLIKSPGLTVVGVLGIALGVGDPGVIGQPILMGDVQHAIVGIMPPGFAFPKNQEVWTPLRLDPSRYPRGEGPELHVFGRLAPGATPEQAQVELIAFGERRDCVPGNERTAPPTHYPYTQPLDDVQDVTMWELAQISRWRR